MHLAVRAGHAALHPPCMHILPQLSWPRPLPSVPRPTNDCRQSADVVFKVWSAALGSLAGDMCVGGEAAAGLMQWLFSRVFDETVASVLTPQVLGKQVFSFQVRAK